MEFPLTYGATFSDTYADEQGNNFADYYETAEFTATVDAWGSMILPSGTFEEVLRVRYEIEGEFVSIEFGSEETETFTETVYAYFTPGIPSPLIRVSERITDGQWFTYSRLYYDADVVSTDDAADVNNTRVYPSPAKEILQVELDLNTSTVVQLDVFDLSGKRVLSQNQGILPAGKNALNLSVGSLANDMYITVIRTSGGNVSRKFVVQN